jgi:hypothetical protein
MDDYVVQSAEKMTNGQGVPIWLVSMLKPDGTIHCLALPPSAIEWRMAEYGLDDTDEALDMVLHEPWATSPTDPLQARDDAAVRVGMVVRTPGPVEDYEPIRLHNADSISDARAAHRLRIADAKKRVQVTAPKGREDPLDAIRQQHGVTEEGLRMKTALVDAARCGMRGEAVPEETRRVLAELPENRLMEEISRA